MQKIGQGWQFNVYDRGEHVEKIRTTRTQIRWKLARTYPRLVLQPAAFTQKINRILDEREEVLAELFRRNADADLFANLHIHEGRIFQDKVRLLGEVFREADEAEGRALIDQYIAFNEQCWQRGMAETSFNFTVNHGLDAQGRIVIVDVGELTFRKADVLKDIEVRLWERSWSFLQDLPERFRAYFHAAMTEHFTSAALDRHWQSARMRRARPILRPDRPAMPKRMAHPKRPAMHRAPVMS